MGERVMQSFRWEDAHRLHSSQREGGKVCSLFKVQWPELRGFPPDDSYFFYVVGVLVEKEQRGCLEKMQRRGERVVLRNMGRLWGNVVLPEERIKDSGAGELRVLAREWLICWSLGSSLGREEMREDWRVKIWVVRREAEGCGNEISGRLWGRG